MTLESISSTEAGVSMIVRPKRLPVLEVEFRSSVSIARPGTTISSTTDSSWAFVLHTIVTVHKNSVKNPFDFGIFSKNDGITLFP